MKIFADTPKNKFEFETYIEKDDILIIKDDKSIRYDMTPLGNGRYSLIKENKSYIVHLVKNEETYHVHVLGDYFPVKVEDERIRKVKELVKSSQSGPTEKIIKATIPGLVVKINVEAGKTVSEGESLIVLEAMKMENIIKAPCDCKINEISVKENDAVKQNQDLIKMISVD